MKISTKGRYGLRALLDLAVHADGGATTLALIAERQQISVGYLEQIFATLRKADIVVGRKGPQGGYLLASPAEQISISHVLSVLEGDLFTIVEDPVETLTAIRAQNVTLTEVWKRISDAAVAALTGLTLDALVTLYNQSGDDGSFMYYI